MKVIRSRKIKKALNEYGRVYLCGDLQNDNGLDHIKTDGYEMGMSYYHEYTFEKAHEHVSNVEYNYVISGRVKLFVLAEKKEYEFKAGDLFAVETNEPTVGKMLPGTRILFTKTPGGNDKKIVDMDDDLKQWGAAWDNKYGEKNKNNKAHTSISMKEARKMIIDAYQVALRESIDSTGAETPKDEKRTNRSFWGLFRSCAAESYDMMKKFIPALATIFGLLLASPPIVIFYNYVVCGVIITAVLAACGFFIYSLIKFSREKYTKRYKDFTLEIKIKDYIENMIDVLLEYKDKRNTAPVFAVGINETVLERICDQTTYEKIDENSLVSLSHDFFIFAELLGIDLKEELRSTLSGSGLRPKKGDVFTIDLEAKPTCRACKPLNNAKFTVIYYVNSSSEGSNPGEEAKDEYLKTEDGKETVIHLIDKASDYLYKKGKGNEQNFVMMIPAIGTGKTGKAPYRNILIEMINELSVSRYSIPNKVILSLRNQELFTSNYEVSSLLRLAKEIMRYKKKKIE